MGLVGVAYDFGKHLDRAYGCGEDIEVAEADTTGDPTVAVDAPVRIARA